MKYICNLLIVKDIEKSKKFYCDLLDMKITDDFGANVVLNNVLALQTLDTWKDFINKKVIVKNNCGEVYFETDNIEVFYNKLCNANVDFVHKLKEHSWGQKVIRFYDLDSNIIEVGENMEIVIKRYISQGKTKSEILKIMDIDESYYDKLNGKSK